MTNFVPRVCVKMSWNPRTKFVFDWKQINGRVYSTDHRVGWFVGESRKTEFKCTDEAFVNSVIPVTRAAAII